MEQEPQNTNIPVSAPPLQPTTSHHLHWTLLAVAVVAIGAGVLIAIKNFGTKEEILVLESPMVTEVKKTDIETKNWQIYKNDQFGFELRYPRNLYFMKEKGMLLSVQNSPLPLELGGMVPEGAEGKDFVTQGYAFYITLKDKQDIEKEISDKYNYIVEEFSLSHIATKVIRYEYTSGISRGPSVAIPHPKLTSKYIIVSYLALCDEDNICTIPQVEQIYNQILSTFKFTAP